MSFFGRIWDRITGHKTSAPTSSRPSTPTPSPTAQPTPAPSATAFTAQPVDVEEVLNQMATMKGGGGNWRTSIVDLLKLLDLDSSLEARKGLAEELDVHAGPHGSAEQNIALSKAVWKRLAQNGGQVPPSLRD